MKIAHSNILLASNRTFKQRDEERENLRVWLGSGEHGISGDKISISKKAVCCLTEADENVDDHKADINMEARTTLEALLVEILSGKKVEILDASLFEKDRHPECEGQDPTQTQGESPQEREGWGVSYHYQKSHYEREDVSFAAAGVIKTTDGAEVDFSLRLDMSREFTTHHNIDLRAGDAVLMDPLVVNFDGKSSDLSNMTFSFDLDSDGIEEELPMIRPGSGWLSFDSNGDGMINNGSELFGPSTGNGFAELAGYDSDGNDWIDENDPVYDRLSIWSMDNLGNSSLNSLRDKGIGAIYTGNVSTQFALKGGNNELVGQMSRTGIFLYENGMPGTIHQLNLVI